MIQIAREALRYGVVSFLAFGVDVALLVGLVEMFHAPYLPAAVTAFIAGGLVAYALCVRLVFTYRRIADRRLEATTFVLLGIAGLVVNTAGIVVGVEWLGLHYLVAKMGAACLSFAVNFALRRLALFTRRHPGTG